MAKLTKSEKKLLAADPNLAAYTDEHLERVSSIAAMSDMSGLENNTFNDLQEIKKERIKTYSEGAIRREAARERYAKKNEELSIGIDAALRAGDATAVENMLKVQKAIPSDDKYAMEKQAIENLVDIASADETGITGAIFASNIDKPYSALKVAEEDQTKKMILMNELESMRRERIAITQDSPIEFILNVVDETVNTLLLQSSFDSTDSYFPFGSEGSLIQNEISRLWKLPVDEFVKGVQELRQKRIDDAGLLGGNIHIATNQMEKYVNINEISANKLSAISGIEAASVVPWWKLPALGRLAKDKVQILKATKNDRLLGEATAEVILQETAATTIQKGNTALLAEALPASRPSDIVSGASSEVQKIVAAQDETLKQALEDLVTAERMTTDEAASAYESTRARLEKEFDGEGFIQFKEEVDPQTQNRFVATFLGHKKANKPYVSENAAIAGASARGLKVDAYDVVQDGGGWYIKIRKPITEKGALGAFTTEDISNKTVSGAWLSPNPRSYIGERFASGAKSSLESAVGLQEAFGKLVKSINSNRTKELDTLWEFEKREAPTRGDWLNEEEVRGFFMTNFGREPTDKELLAHATYRQINDFDWTLRNQEIYNRLTTQGYETITLKDAKTSFNGRKLSFNEAVARTDAYAFDRNSGQIFKIGSLESGRLKKWYDEGRVVTQTDLPFSESPKPVFYVIDSADNVASSPLKPVQLAYSPGGHRIYKSKWFVKQPRRGKYDDGTAYVGSPRTFVAARTKTEATEWADSMNNIRVAYKKWKDGEISQAALVETIQSQKYTVSGIKEFEDFIDSGKIDLDEEFTVAFDRQPTEIPAGAVDATGGLPDDIQYYNTIGRLYYSQKGKHLPTVDGSDAPLLTPLQSMQQGVSNAIKNAAFADFKVSEVERWVNTFGGLIDKTKLPSNPTMWDIFRGEFKQSAVAGNMTKEQYAQALASRDYINRVLRTPSDVGMKAQLMMRRAAEWMEEGGIGGKKAATLVYDKLSADPMAAARGFAYDINLGAWNIGQLPLQATSALTAMSIDPVRGLPAFYDAWFIRAAMINTNKSFWNHLAKAAALVNGKDPQYYLDTFETYRKSSLHHIGRDHALIDQAQTTPMGTVYSVSDTIRQSGRMFAYEGDRWGRMVGFGIARREFMEKFPAKSPTGPEAIRYYRAKTHDYTLNMNSAETSAWQRNPITALPTQFWSYPLRVHQAILGKKSPLNGMQRTRLAVGQTLLWGAAGIPFGAWVLDKYNQVTGNEMDEETYKTWTTGLVDTLIRTTTEGEVDTNIASSVGTGNFVVQTLDNLLNQDSALGFIAGASGGVGQRVYKAWQDLALLQYNERVGMIDYSLEVATEVGSVAKSWDNLTKAWYLWNHQRVLVNSGGWLEESKYQALATAMNFPSWKETARYKMYDTTSDYYQNRIKTVAKSAMQYRIKFLDTGDEKYIEYSTGMLQALDPRTRKDVIKAMKKLRDDRYYRALKTYTEINGANKSIVPEHLR